MLLQRGWSVWSGEYTLMLKDAGQPEKVLLENGVAGARLVTSFLVALEDLDFCLPVHLSHDC